jgi:hypothetical protein
MSTYAHREAAQRVAVEQGRVGEVPSLVHHAEPVALDGAPRRGSVRLVRLGRVEEHVRDQEEEQNIQNVPRAAHFFFLLALLAEPFFRAVDIVRARDAVPVDTPEPCTATWLFMLLLALCSDVSLCYDVASLGAAAALKWLVILTVVTVWISV